MEMKRRGFMKKLLLSLLVLTLFGCSNKSLLFKGESEHWKGEYSADITNDTREDGQFIFKLKKGNKVKKNLEININNGQTVRTEELNNETTITIPNACSGCSVTSKSSPIEVTIKWNNQEETFKLKKK
jgi:hypothetical protein